MGPLCIDWPTPPGCPCGGTPEPSNGAIILTVAGVGTNYRACCIDSITRPRTTRTSNKVRDPSFETQRSLAPWWHNSTAASSLWRTKPGSFTRAVSPRFTSWQRPMATTPLFRLQKRRLRHRKALITFFLFKGSHIDQQIRSKRLTVV